MKLLSWASLAMLAIAAVSCDSSSSLAKKVEGSWAGNPVSVVDTQASSATLIETYTFSLDTPESKGGTVAVSALMSVTGNISGTDGINVPLSLTASGTANITGTWEAISADKIVLKLDIAGMQVNVDPDAVMLADNVLTGSENSVVGEVKPRLAQSVAEQFRHILSGRFAEEMTLEEVKVSDTTPAVLTFKYDKATFTLSRQPS